MSVEVEDAKGTPAVSKGPTLGTRHLQVLMLVTGMFIIYTMRINMSIAMVAMTDPAAGGTFDWSMQRQSVILSSFFWGYGLLQIPSGELAAKYGGGILLILSVGVNSAVSLLTPLAAYYGGWQVLCACRFAQGLAQGCMYPSMNNLVRLWAPMDEKSRLATLVFAGGHLGTASQLIAAGFIADSWGWPAIFYVDGGLGVAWVVLYAFLGADSPEKSRIISLEERRYIQNSMGQTGERKVFKTPWKKIFTSLPFWALIVMHSGHNWGFWTLLTEMPSYMNLVLGVNIKANGVLSALPYLALYFLSIPFGFISDYILKKKWLSLTACRKLSTALGEYGPAIALVGLCFVPAGQLALAVSLLTLVVGLNAGHLSGFLISHIDLAPNFAGTLMGITNFCANICAIIAPLVAGAILTDESDPLLWRRVFYVSCAIYVSATTFYMIFGSCENQPWNEPDKSEEASSKEIEGGGKRK